MKGGRGAWPSVHRDACLNEKENGNSPKLKVKSEEKGTKTVR